MMLTEEEKQIAAETSRRILLEYDRGKGNLIPVLQHIQGELGYIAPQAMREVAVYLAIPPVDVYGVVTFYNQFRLTPPGKHQVKVCTGTACHMKGAQIILDAWERRLEIKVGETTRDREFSLERVACVGCCTMAPVMLYDEQVQAKATPSRVDGLLFAHRLAEQQREEKEQKEGGNQ
ncbi:MAG: NADH-quinone oxidoreductase subunit NuoE [Bacillota bacterium]|jgi:NADH-quinone oxidoreductase subunit E